MKRILFFLCVLILSSVNTIVMAYDFNAVNSYGDTIYYKITSSNSPCTVGVTYRANAYSLADSMVYVDTINIPSTVFYNGITYSVTSIETYAFRFCSHLTTVTIPNSVTSIGDEAFKFCNNLTSINLPNSITTIGMFAFTGCKNLSSIIIPDSLSIISEGTFLGCESLTSISIPNSVTSIQHSVFSGCYGLTSITIPNSVTSIGISCFSGCSGLTSFSIPNSLSYISQNTFQGCSGLISITIPNNIITIAPSAFKNCSSLQSIIIPNTVSSLGYNVFENCTSLTSINLPNSINTIMTSTFQNCTSLSSIKIPCTIRDIRAAAFNNCSGLTSITCLGLPPTVGYIAFDGIPDSIPVIVPCNSINLYQTSSYWNYFNNFIPALICVSSSDTNLSTTSITLRASTSDTSYSQRGFMWRKLGESSFNTHINTTIPFEYTIQNLVPNTRYEYMAFVVSNNETYYSIIDTFATFECLSAYYSNVTSNSATLHASSSLSNYVSKGFQWKKLGEADFNSYADTSSVYQFILNNLLPFTQYEYRAYIEINNGYSYSKLDTFYTLCSSGVLSLPFVEDFNNTLTCWISFSSNNNLLNQVNIGDYPTCNPHSGSKMIKYNSYIIQAGNYAGYMTPKVNLSPVSKLSFWIYRYNSQWSNNNEGVRLYSNANPSLNNAEELGFISNNRLAPPTLSSDGWYNYIVDIPSSQIGEKYIILKAESKNGYNIYIDDLSIYSIPTVTTNINASICNGDTYSLNGFNVDSAGTYFQNLNTINGADSIVILNLSIYPIVDTTHFNASICQGQTYTLNGFNESISGTYYQNLQTVNGCDSTVSLVLEVNNVETPNNLLIESTENHFIISWHGDGSAYVIYRNNDSIATVSDTIYNDNDLIIGENYCYKIKSIYGNCESEISNEVCRLFSNLEDINIRSLRIYPNPANNYVIIEGEGIEEISIYNINGQKIYSEKVNNQESIKINTSEYLPGTYSFKIIFSNGNVSNKKLIIAR